MTIDIPSSPDSESMFVLSDTSPIAIAAGTALDAALKPIKAVEVGEVAEIQDVDSVDGNGNGFVKQYEEGKKELGKEKAKAKAGPMPITPPQWKSVNAIIVHAIKGGLRSFLLAYAMRGGISFLIKLVRVVMGKARFTSALRSFFAPDSKRFALMIGTFSLTYKLLNNLLFFYRRKQSKLNGFISGSIASLSLLFESPETRSSIAQQFFIRSMQAGYNALKARDVVYFPYGDTMLFMIACGSIMYAYIMQPDTIPREYYSWMVKTARMPGPMLDLNRTNYRNRIEGKVNVDPEGIVRLITGNREGYKKVQLDRALEYLKKNGNTLPIVPCAVLHPTDESCLGYNAKLALRVAWGIAPVYAALNFVPMLLLKTGAFAKSPLNLTRRGLLSTLRSSTFLSIFVVIYMSGICLQRTLAISSLPIPLPTFFRHDHKLWYYILGLLCSSSILIELKSRRSELAMYVLPKGLQSLWMVLYKRGAVVRVPGFELGMSSLAMGILMSFYQTEPEHMSSLLFKVMEKVIGRY